jgi:hypothetical protein
LGTPGESAEAVEPPINNSEIIKRQVNEKAVIFIFIEITFFIVMTPYCNGLPVQAGRAVARPEHELAESRVFLI